MALPKDRANRLFLVGYRGSGKTTVGRIVAARLGWDFFDADAVLEERAGRSIADIFAADGEVGFRAREAAVLADLCRLHNGVLATGGGAILRADNRALLRSGGYVAWLAADCGTVWQRTIADPTTAGRRPNLTARGGSEEVRELLAAREPLYRETADVRVETAGLSPGAVADAILYAWTNG